MKLYILKLNSAFFAKVVCRAWRCVARRGLSRRRRHKHERRQPNRGQQRNVKVRQARVQALLLQADVEQVRQGGPADKGTQHLDHADERIQARRERGVHVVRDGGPGQRAVRGAERRDDEPEDEDDDVGAEALDGGADDEDRRRRACEEQVLAKDGVAVAGRGEAGGDARQAAEDDEGEDAERGEQNGRLAQAPAVVLGDVLDERGRVGRHARVLEEKGDEHDGHVAVVAEHGERRAEVVEALGQERGEADRGRGGGRCDMDGEGLGEEEQDADEQGRDEDDDPDGHPGPELGHEEASDERAEKATGGRSKAHV